MKLTKLTIKNVGLIADTTVELNKPLILFYGEIQQGKSTILNAVRWAFGGTFPSDIIRHGADEASVCLEFGGGSITREWYRGKNGTKAREIVFIRDGKPVSDRVSALKEFLNPFLLDQNHLINMGEKERARFFVDLFGVPTATLDHEIAVSEKTAETLRAMIKTYGEITVSEVAQPDVAVIRQKIENEQRIHAGGVAQAKIRIAERQAKHLANRASADALRTSAAQHNREVSETQEKLEKNRLQIETLKSEIQKLEGYQEVNRNWLRDNPLKLLPEYPAEPDHNADQVILASQPNLAALQSELEKALVDQVRFEQAAKDKARLAEKQGKILLLSGAEGATKELRSGRIAKLKQVSEKCGIPGLVFDAEGSFSFENVTAGMLSTSQLMKLSSLLSAKYPSGFGLDLIDRAESLGKSVFKLVERAKAEDKTILATIVGEKPATAPDDVGVFIVEAGQVVSAGCPCGTNEALTGDNSGACSAGH